MGGLRRRESRRDNAGGAEGKIDLLPGQEKKGQILQILVPILVSQLLQAEGMKGANRLRLRLHASALAKLTRLVGGFPAELKTILAETPELKARLEAAVLADRERVAHAQSDAANAAAAALAQKKAQEHKPSIELKMDFSNFGGKK